VNRIDEYRAKLRTVPDLEPFLLAESGLPGPRGNLELAQACALELPASVLTRFLKYTPQRAPSNTPHEFLAFCGVLGLGGPAARGDERAWQRLRQLARDPRWRVREAVAMALQHVGRSDMAMLLARMRGWLSDAPLVQRALAAGLCEPDLLTRERDVAHVLRFLARVTAQFARPKPKDDDRLVLRQALGYCWSVAVAAQPALGKPAFERLTPPASADVLWIVKENLGKKRLARMDAAWVAQCQRRLTHAAAASGSSKRRGNPA
jgi:hypothetical protein